MTPASPSTGDSGATLARRVLAS